MLAMVGAGEASASVGARVLRCAIRTVLAALTVGLPPAGPVALDRVAKLQEQLSEPGWSGL